MQAVIMAGGVGSRLRPLTNNIPKPMVNIIDKPALYHIVKLMRDFGFYDIGLTVGYKSEIIKNYFGDGSDFGVRLTYFTEDKPLGTAGSVKACERYLDNDFLVMSGDAFTDIDLAELRYAHSAKNNPVTIAVKEVENVSGFGVVKVQNGVVVDFIEKPRNSTEKTVNTGIYMLKRDVLKHIPNGFYDFGRDLFPRLKHNMTAYKTDKYWSDIGTLERYYEANLYVAKSMNYADFQPSFVNA